MFSREQPPRRPGKNNVAGEIKWKKQHTPGVGDLLPELTSHRAGARGMDPMNSQ